MTENSYSIELLKTKFSKISNGSSERCDLSSSCAAILIPIICKDSEWHLLFTRRTGKVSSHQNEVSFPGGSYETTDQSLEKTALRETFEEIGVEEKDIQILGELPFSITVTGFTVFPFIGLINWPVELKVSDEEVESVFSIPVTWLADPENSYEKDYLSDKFGLRKVIHYKDYQGEHLWGYTAKVTQQFLTFLK